MNWHWVRRVVVQPWPSAGRILTWRAGGLFVCVVGLLFSFTMILCCLVNVLMCIQQTVELLSSDYSYVLVSSSCGSSGRTAEKSSVNFKSDQVKVKQEPGTEEEICSFSGAVKQEKTEDGRRSACMVKLVCAAVWYSFPSSVWKNLEIIKPFWKQPNRKQNLISVWSMLRTFNTVFCQTQGSLPYKLYL